MLPDLILAHDIGTTGNKATLYNVDGSLAASATSDYATNFFNGTWAEQDPEEWWRTVIESTRAVIAGIDVERIGALSFSGQMMGCVCVDRNGNALRPAIIWADQRATKEVDDLLARLPMDEGYAIAGHRISPSYSLAKLLWVREHEPHVFRDTHKALQAKDLIVHRLTGAWTTDHSDASGTNALDLSTLEWSSRILEASGLDRAILPDERCQDPVALVPAKRGGLPGGMSSILASAQRAGDWRRSPARIAQFGEASGDLLDDLARTAGVAHHLPSSDEGVKGVALEDYLGRDLQFDPHGPRDALLDAITPDLASGAVHEVDRVL